MVDPFGTLQLEWMQKMDQTNQLDPTWRMGSQDGRKWLITMGDRCCCPLRIGLWDPLQMAELHGL